MWETMSGFEKTFWLIGIPATAVFFIQTLLAVFGIAHDHGDFSGSHHDGAADGSHFPILTIRNLVVFLMIFGWTGITMLHQTHAGRAVVIGVALLAALVMMFAVASMFFGFAKLTSSGKVEIDTSVIGKQASVYLKIPAQRAGEGKITLSVNGSLKELKALTEGPELPTGSQAKIVAVESDRIIVVKA